MALDRCDITGVHECGHFTLEDSQMAMVKVYHKLLVKWSNKLSMISDPLDWQSFWDRHFLDCLQLLPLVNEHLNHGRVVDVGSGAGLPGLILAILGVDNICLVERDIRKAAFLQAVAAEIGLQIEIFPDDVRKLQDKFSVIISRAVGGVDELISLTKNIRQIDSAMLLLKSKKQLNSELGKALKVWHFKSHMYDSISSKEGAILQLTDIKER